MDSVANDSQKIIVDLRRRLEALTAERDDALAQQAAATEVLQVINSSTGDLTPAFDMIVEKAVRLCDASGGTLWLVKDGMARATGGRNVPTPFYEYLAPESVPIRYILGRDGQHRPYIHTLDLKATKPYKEGVPFFIASVDLGKARTVLSSIVGGWHSHRRNCPDPQGGAAIHHKPNRSGQKFCRSGSDRHRECAAVQ
jgi:hypothetical protein